MTDENVLKISEIESDATAEVEYYTSLFQKSYQSSGVPVQFILNYCDLRTVFKLAEESVTYHGIDPQKLSNVKKFAHICFWITKLKPVYAVEKRSLVTVLSNYLSLDVQGKLGLNEGMDDEMMKKFANIRINEKVGLCLFLHLYFANKKELPIEERRKKIFSVLSDKRVVETIKSARYHNYSARSMSTMLEYFVERYL